MGTFPLPVSGLMREFESHFPLPVPELERTNQLQYIPDVIDEFGYGERIWKIFSMMKITQGSKSGKRFGEDGVHVPWQKKFIESLFGACDKNGIRDYSEALVYISKKQGKSSLSGPLAVAYCLAYPMKRGSIVVVASSIKQSSIIFDSMAETIRADKSLSKMFMIRDYKKDCIHLATKTKIQILALAPETVVGQILDLLLVDELHTIASKTGSKQLLEQLISGMSTTANPLTIYTTTAPLNVSKGVFSSTYARAKRVLAGKSPHDRFFPVMFELPVSKWEDESYISNPDNWWRCCPSMDYTVSKAWLVKAHETAVLDQDPSSLFNFKAQHLNIIMGAVINIERFLELVVWNKFVDPRITLEYIKEEADEIYMGIDLGSRDDPSALMVGGLMPSGRILIWSQQYLHHDGYMKHYGVVDYDSFIEAGELIVSDVESFDIDEMSKLVTEMYETGKLAGVAVDPMGLKEFVSDLEDELEGIQFIGITQGYKMTPAILATERKIYKGDIWHQGLPMLAWNIENTSLKQHGEAVALIKPDSLQTSALKIDGVICLVGICSLVDDPEIVADSGSEVVFV